MVSTKAPTMLRLYRIAVGGGATSDRLAIKAIFERCDYWHLLFPSNPPEIDIEAVGVDQYFMQAMDAACQRRQATHWLEKTPAHTLVLAHLVHAFPEAKFVAVERDSFDTTRSNVHKFADPQNVFHWVKAAIWTTFYRKMLDLFQDRVYRVTYDALVEDTQGAMSKVFAYLDIETHDINTQQWDRNSSYKGKPPDTPRYIRVTVKLITTLIDLLPAAFCGWLAKMYTTKRRRFLPRWFFRVYEGQKVPNE